MSQKRIILVTGAAGAQGGSVARALLAQNKFAVRILTRNGASEKAIALQSAGAEIVEGDLDNIESLRIAMKDCYGVFGVTSFWKHFDKQYEQGRNLIGAVSQSGIKHFVFSSPGNYSKQSSGAMQVLHNGMKAVLQDYATGLQLHGTFVQASFYYENFLYSVPLEGDGNGGFYFGLPQGDTRLATASVEDYGGIIAAVFNYPLEYTGRTVRVVGSDKTCAEYAAIMSKILGKNIHFNYIPREEYAAYSPPVSEDIDRTFEVQRLNNPNSQLDLIESYGLNPNMQSFESWLKKNSHKFENLLNVAEALV